MSNETKMFIKGFILGIVFLSQVIGISNNYENLLSSKNTIMEIIEKWDYMK